LWRAFGSLAQLRDRWPQRGAQQQASS